MLSSVLLVTALLLGLLGFVIFFKLKQLSVEKNLSHQVSSFVIDGIRAYGVRSFSSILQIILYTSLVLLSLSFILDKPFSWLQISAFFCGGLAMSLSLFIVTILIPRLIPKIIDQSKGYFKDTLRIQFNIISMLGFIIISVILLSFFALFELTSYDTLIGYGLGVIFASFFMRIGGGLFKASVDIGKSVSNERYPQLPHEDERNPALLLDISGDYIGKLCGFSSDIIGSFVLCITAGIIFAEAFSIHAILPEPVILQLSMLPLSLLSISLAATVFGFFIALYRISTHHFQNVLLESLYAALIISGIGTAYAMHTLPSALPNSIWVGFRDFHPFIAYLSGLIGASVTCFTAEILTSYRYNCSKKLAEHAEFSNPISFLYGLSLGLKSNAVYLLYLLAICGTAYYSAGFYGIVLAGLGMLSVTPTIISINSFGPLASSTQKIASLSTSSKTVLTHTNKLQTLGQTTIAIGSGFSSMTAFMSTASLFFAFICLKGYTLHELFSINVLWFAGLLAGLMIPLVSSGVLLQQVISISLYIAKEVKRQFDEIPFLKEGKAKPDIIKIADKTACKSMDGLIIPGLLIVLIPILIGYFLDSSVLIGFTLGTFLIGSSLSFVWAITGDSVNNAKHYIQNGHCGGPESQAYAAIQQSDTISDAYKDILSPSFNIVIKSVMIVSIVMIILLH